MKYIGRFIVIIVLLLSLAWFFGYSQKAQESSLLNPELQKALEGICIDDLFSHILFLASDELQGRPTPSVHLDIAGRYIEEEFFEYNLIPGGGNNSFEQFYTINIYPDQREKLSASFSFAGLEWTLSKEEIYPVLSGLAGTSIDAEGNVVFAGYGITAPERGWDDYQNLDVRGKVVLVVEGAPWEVDYNDLSNYDKFGGKRKSATQRGAVGFIYGTSFRSRQEHRHSAFEKTFTNGYLLQRKSLNPRIYSGIPSILTSIKVASQIAKNANDGNLNTLMDLMDTEKKSLNTLLEGLRFSLKLDAEPREERAFNVIGILKGSDPKLANEYIAITAHYDHIGVGNPVDGDSIYNGADDNASGTAGVLELAEAFSSLPEAFHPRRSILFMLVSGEEVGLFGSCHFAENPTVPIKRIKANINLDMIGRCPEKGVEIIAPGSNWLSKMMITNAQSLGLKALPEQHPEMRLIFYSDQYPFAYRKIPVLFCFTGLHSDYHQPSDEIDKLNFPKMEKIVRTVFLTTLKLANREKIPVFRPPAYFVVQP